MEYINRLLSGRKSGGGTSKPKPGARSELSGENKSGIVGEESFVSDKGDQLSECSFISANSQSKGVDTDTDTTADYESAGESDTSPFGSLLVQQDVRSPGSHSTSTAYSISSSDQDGELTVINANTTFTDCNPLSVTRLADELESVLNISTPTKKEAFTPSSTLPDCDSSVNTSNPKVDSSSNEIQERFKELTSNIFSFVASRQESNNLSDTEVCKPDVTESEKGSTVPLPTLSESNDVTIPGCIVASDNCTILNELNSQNTECDEANLLVEDHRETEHVAPKDPEVTELSPISPNVDIQLLDTDVKIVFTSLNNNLTEDSSSFHEVLSTSLPKSPVNLVEDDFQSNESQVKVSVHDEVVTKSDDEQLNSSIPIVCSYNIGKVPGVDFDESFGKEGVHNEGLDEKSLSESFNCGEQLNTNSDQPLVSLEYSGVTNNVQETVSLISVDASECRSNFKTSESNFQENVVEENVQVSIKEEAVDLSHSDPSSSFTRSLNDTVPLITNQTASESILPDQTSGVIDGGNNLASVSNVSIPVVDEVVKNEQLSGDKIEDVILLENSNISIPAETHAESGKLGLFDSVTSADNINQSAKVETGSDILPFTAQESHSTETSSPGVLVKYAEELQFNKTVEVEKVEVDKSTDKEYVNETENVLLDDGTKTEPVKSEKLEVGKCSVKELQFNKTEETEKVEVDKSTEIEYVNETEHVLLDDGTRTEPVTSEKIEVDKCTVKELQFNKTEEIVVDECIVKESFSSEIEEVLLGKGSKKEPVVESDKVTTVDQSTQKELHTGKTDPLLSDKSVVVESIGNPNIVSENLLSCAIEVPEPSFVSDGAALLKECVDASVHGGLCNGSSQADHLIGTARDQIQSSIEPTEKKSIDELGALFEELKINQSVTNDENILSGGVVDNKSDIEIPLVDAELNISIDHKTKHVRDQVHHSSDIVSTPGKPYKDMSELIATCSKQEKELQSISEDDNFLHFDETFTEEAKKIALEISSVCLSSSVLSDSGCDIKEMRDMPIKDVSQKISRADANYSDELNDECMMRSAASPDINRSEAGPVTADEHFCEGESFQDAAKFDFEFLSRLDNQPKRKNLVRQSLIVKFDPLYQPVANQESQKIIAAMSDSASSETEIKISQDGGGATPKKPNDDSDPVQKLVSLTPHKSETPTRPKTAVNSLSTPPAVRQDILSKEILKLQELMIQQEQSYQEQLVSKTEMIEVQKQRIEELEAKDSRDTLEDKLKTTEAKLKSTEIKLSKSEKELADSTLSKKQLTMIMEEYEKTISQLVTKREDEKKEFEQVKENIASERDAALKHLSNMEVAFNDVHLKYERCKTVIEQMKVNEAAFKESLAVNEKTIKKLEADYLKLKKHASEKLEAANEELAALRRSHHGEVAKLKAIAKKAEIKNKSLEDSLEQKQKEVRELTQICDELIGKVEHQ